MDCLGVNFIVLKHNKIGWNLYEIPNFYNNRVGKKKSFLLFFPFIYKIYLISHLLRRTVSHGSAASHERVALPNEHAIFQLGTIVAVADIIWMADKAAFLLPLSLLLLNTFANCVPRDLLLQ
jgi:hypothetical protein